MRWTCACRRARSSVSAIIVASIYTKHRQLHGVWDGTARHQSYCRYLLCEGRVNVQTANESVARLADFAERPRGGAQRGMQNAGQERPGSGCQHASLVIGSGNSTSTGCLCARKDALQGFVHNIASQDDPSPTVPWQIVKHRNPTAVGTETDRHHSACDWRLCPSPG